MVLASHPVNVAGPAVRRSSLETASRHVRPAGGVFVQHWSPEGELADRGARAGGVHIAFRILDQRGEEFDGQVTSTIGERSWTQTFTATVLDEDALDAAPAQVRLRRRRLAPTWLVAERTPEASARSGSLRPASRLRPTRWRSPSEHKPQRESEPARAVCTQSGTVAGMAKVVPVREFRARLAELLNEVADRREHVTITRHGRPEAVVVPADEYTALEETAEILSDSDTLAAIKKGLEELAAGEVVALDAVRKELRARHRVE